MVSAFGSPSLIRDLVRAGVAGFVTKREPKGSLFEAIDTVLEGGQWTSPELAAILANDQREDRPALSDQEQRVLVLFASGLKLNSVARRLDISPHTAKEYIDRVRAKYAAVGRHAPTKSHLCQEAVGTACSTLAKSETEAIRPPKWDLLADAPSCLRIRSDLHPKLAVLEDLPAGFRLDLRFFDTGTLEMLSHRSAHGHCRWPPEPPLRQCRSVC